MEFLRIKETCIYVKDLDRTKAFYHDKLGLEVISHEEGSHLFFRAGTSVLLCFLPEVSKHKKHLPAHHGEGHLHFAFQVRKADYEACKQTIISAGIAIEHEEEWGRGLQSFYFRDPDHHSVEVVMEGMWDRHDQMK